MGEVAYYWVRRLIAALGGVVPQDPTEVLRVLGALLRADPAEKDRFIREAHEVWVKGASWAVKGDSSPETRVVLMALEEATRRLAEKYRWVREAAPRPRVRVAQDNIWEARVKIARQAKGEGVFYISPGGLSDKALWAAAHRVVKGAEVTLVAPPALEGVARKVARMIARRAAELDGGRSTPTVRTPQGQVRLLYGDRWEAPDAPEPRLRWAWEVLQEALPKEEPDPEDRDWVHQTRVDPGLVRDLLGEEAQGVEIAYLVDHSLVQAALTHLDEVVGDKEFNVYAPATASRVVRPWFERFVPKGLPTYGEVREAWEGFLEIRGRREIWHSGRLFRFLALLAAAEALIARARDPESAVMEAAAEALAEAKRLRRKERWDRLNPLVFLAPVVRRKVAECRAREFGVTRISRDEARAVGRYFRHRHKGLSPEEAAKKAGLPEHLQEAILNGHGAAAVSTEYLREFGLEPTLEPDYDTLLLRAKVREVLEEIKLVWGEKGVLFVEHLMSGREIPAAQAVTPGLTPTQGEEIVAHLRRELEGWAEA